MIERENRRIDGSRDNPDDRRERFNQQHLERGHEIQMDLAGNSHCSCGAWYVLSVLPKEPVEGGHR